MDELASFSEALAALHAAAARQREWIVVSTVLADCALLVECARTGAIGLVRNPTGDEWSEAFHAPSQPYRWRGGDERVELQDDVH